MRLLHALAALACLAAPAAAQAPEPATGRSSPAPQELRGRVVDAASGDPLAAVSVALYEGPGGPGDGAVARNGDAAPPSPRKVAETATDHTGRYRFRSVPPGRYRLVVERLGYRTLRIGVEVDASPRGLVSVGLEVEPIALDPLEIQVAGEVQMLSASGDPVAVGRVTAERLRQERFLSPDSRILGPSDVAEGATLGEDDVFRAVQRLPGVTTRDDFSAELWTRGADWGRTRVYLDGMPLFNPLHGFGVLSGVSPHAIGSLAFHPGVRSAAVPEGSAAVVDLRSRSGLASPTLEGGADLTLASAQGWASGRVGDRSGWALTARRSWVDVAAEGLREDLPYAFWDVQTRVDGALGERTRVEAVALIEGDRIRGDIPDVLQGTTASWGNVLVSASLAGTLGDDLTWRQTVGGTRYVAAVDSFASAFDTVFNAPHEPPSDHRVHYWALRGELGPAGVEGTPWRAGWELTRQSSRYEGPAPWPYSARPPERPELERETALTRATLWGWRRWSWPAGITAEAGLRVSGGTEVGGDALDLLPSGQLRWAPGEAGSLTLGAGRYVQYAQSPAPIGPYVEGVLQTGRWWVVAGDRAPYVRSDLATLGGELWLGTGVLASATAYARRSSGVLLPDPTPGLLVQRSPFVEGRERARGLEIGVRRIAGRTTGSASWTWAHAEAEALGIPFPSPSHRAHTVDVTLSHRITSSLGIVGAYTWTTGAPYTRVIDDCAAPRCSSVVLDAPWQRTGPSYASLDLVLRYQHAFDGWSLGGFLQGRNVLGGRNRVTYRSSATRCTGDAVFFDGGCWDGSTPVVQDQFTDAVPRLPLLGLRVTF